MYYLLLVFVQLVIASLLRHREHAEYMKYLLSSSFNVEK
jgi:hypothetical protein